MKRRSYFRSSFRNCGLCIVAATILSLTAMITMIINNRQCDLIRMSKTSPKESHYAKKIAILTIIGRSVDLPNYQIAMGSIDCYCMHHNYTYVLIIASENDLMQKLCRQKEFLFQRHCIAAHYIAMHDFDYYLIIDGDVGVINPKHRIEEYIVPGKDIIFYNRIWNFEIMSGSYIVKNTRFAIEFLHNWARYDLKQGMQSDNIALHPAVLDYAVNTNKTKCEPIFQLCEYASENDSLFGLFVYEACIRDAMEIDKSWSEHIAILQKGTSWCRDSWLTYSKWSQGDFMLHSWQRERISFKVRGGWVYPFTTKVNLFRDPILCAGPNYLKSWPYDKSLIRTNERIQYALDRIIEDVDQQYQPAVNEAKRIIESGGNFSNPHVMRLLWAGLEEYPDYIDILEATSNPRTGKMAYN